jgi:hypothetical protein
MGTMGEVADSGELLARLTEIAEEQLRWQRAAVLPSVRQTVEAVLSTEQLRRAYEMCDGTNPSKTVAAAVKTSKQNFSGWTRRWRDLGIAYEQMPGRNIKHLASLRSLGIPVSPSE